MDNRARVGCLRCNRKFLSEAARTRHYRRIPEHGEPVTFDVRDLLSTGTKLPNADWVEFEDRVETFLAVSEDVDASSLEMCYLPEEGIVVVSGPLDQEIDVSDVQEIASNRLQWSFDGTYFKLAFLKA